jgi:hypothetical protein
MFAAWETTKSQKIYDAMMAMARDFNQWQPGRNYYHADDHVIFQDFYSQLLLVAIATAPSALRAEPFL